jgi:hypothetical protein
MRSVQRIEDMRIDLARERADDLAYPPRPEQRRQAGIAVAGIVVDDRQSPRALRDEAVDQFAGQSGAAEAAEHDRGAVGHVGERGGDRGESLVDQGMDARTGNRFRAAGTAR